MNKRTLKYGWKQVNKIPNNLMCVYVCMCVCEHVYVDRTSFFPIHRSLGVYLKRSDEGNTFISSSISLELKKESDAKFQLKNKTNRFQYRHHRHHCQIVTIFWIEVATFSQFRWQGESRKPKTESRIYLQFHRMLLPV